MYIHSLSDRVREVKEASQQGPLLFVLTVNVPLVFSSLNR